MSHTTTLRRLIRASATLAVALLSVTTQGVAHVDSRPEVGSIQGFIHGRVTTSSATYEGFLRWDGEEAFWGDHFNGTHDTGRWSDLADGKARGRREPLKLFGITIGMRWDESNVQHLGAVRFGDMARLDIKGQRVTVHLKGGDQLEFDGGSNDIGADIEVLDPSLGAIEIDWDRIDRIDFLPVRTSQRVTAPAKRLHGTLVSEAGTFTGFVQWDLDECLTTDVLDGESADGDHEIPMGQIRRIERRTRSSAQVTLEDGQLLVLDGTNDVDHRNDGIFIETPDLGRVLVRWDAFEHLDLTPAPDSGPAYDHFAPTRRLKGQVTTRDGKHLRGQLVYDLDESLTAEMLNGERQGLEHHIPFALISRIEPLEEGSRVHLVGGAILELEGVVDVDDGNGGILVFGSNTARPTHIPWRDIARIDFDQS